MGDDLQLLRQFAAQRSEAALRELIRQRIDFVYATALRQVGGDAHLAREVAQNVFLDLARKAAALTGRANLTGWLYTSVRFAAAKARRSRVRRLTHETEAHAMSEILGASRDAEIDWRELRPVIDAALHDLSETDRDAILLRFFENRPLAEVGAGIGLNENSARMRVERALEKLRARLAARGITSTTAALGVALAGQPVVTAPAGLAGAAASAVLQSLAGAVGAANAGWSVASFFSWRVLGLTGASLAAGLVAYGVTLTRGETELAAARARDAQEIARLRTEGESARAQQQALAVQATVPAKASVAAPAVSDPLARLRGVVALIQEGPLGPGALRWGFVAPAADVFGHEPGAIERRSGPRATLAIELFALSEAEVAALVAAGELAKQEMTTRAMAHARVQRAADSVTLEVPAVPESPAIQQRMFDAFRRTLGEERYRYFEAVGWAASITEQFKKLGVETYTHTIRRPAVPRSPLAPYEFSSRRGLISDARQMAEGRAGGDRASLAVNLGPIVNLLPADF